MKRNILLVLLAILLPQTGVAAASLSIENFSIKAGDEKEMVINLTNPDDVITLVQFDLSLPSGLSIKRVDGEYDIDIAGRTTWKKHTLNANTQADGTIRFLLASSNNKELCETEGAIIKMTLVSDGDFSGGKIKMDNILMVTPEEKELTQVDYFYYIGQEPPLSGTASLSVEPFSINIGGETEMVIDLTNPNDVTTLVQFDLNLPSGLSLKKVDGEYDIDIAGRTTWKKHSLEANANADGIIRFLLASSSNKELTGTEGAIIKMTIVADGSFTEGDIRLESILMVTPEEKEMTQDDYTYHVGGVLPYHPETASLSIETPFNISAGGEAEMIIDLTNPDDEITLVQFDLKLPNGLSIKKTDGEYDIDITGRTTWKKHSLEANANADGIIRFLLASSSNKELTGTNGAIIKMTLIADGGFTEGDVRIDNILLVTPEEKEILPDVYSYHVIVSVPEYEEVILTAKSYTRVYGDENPTFEYEVSGVDLDGQPEINCEATSTSPVGTYPIVIKKGSVTNYNDTYINGTLTITKAPLTISGGTYSMKQGKQLPTFVATYAGFKNGETLAVLKKQPMLTTTATSASAPGTYEVTVSGAEAENYEISYVAGSLTITKADPVTVTAKNYTREYGEANPTFEYTSEGATLNGTPEITCEATATSPVGTYPIIIKKGGVTNYNDSYINGTLTITKAPLTIKAGTYTRKQGEENPEFTLEYAGFKNGETEAVLTKEPVVTTTATKESEVGDYDVKVSGAEAQNYEISYVNGTLKVTDADPVTVTAMSYTREYGDANPTFEFTSEGATMEGKPEITCEATATSPVGTYPIIIKKGGVTNYNDSYVNGTLTITKAPLTISGGEYVMKQGDAMPTLKAVYAGFKNGETSAVLTKQPTLTTTATSASAPGTYEVIVRGAEAENYEISYVAGTLTIVDADAVVVMAKSYTREYGEANPTFEFTSEGATLEGTPEIVCTATATSPVGTYPIVIKKGSVTNYNDSYVNGVLTITKAPLTIGGGGYTMKQGEDVPMLKAVYSGFKNGETEAVLKTKPMLKTTATSGSEPGVYEVTVSGAEAENYEISYVAGKLTILEADAVVVTAKSYTREYGEANPTFEFTSEGAALEGTPEIVCTATATSPVGTYPIVIKKGGVTNYNDSYVNGTLTITKAPLTISGGEYTMKQGEDVPMLKAVYSGFKNGETEAVLKTKPMLKTTATSGSEPGVYEVTVSGAEAENYEISYVAGKLTILEADAVVVTAKSYTREYGEANPTFEFTSEGAALEGTPEIVCTATATSPVGTYPIIIKKGSVKNYNDQYVSGVLTITKAPLKVTVADVTREQGEENPEFVITYEGWKNGETETVLTKKPVATTTATKDSAVGEYVIVVGGGEAQNYELSYVNGKLAVTVPNGIHELLSGGTFDVYTTSGKLIRKGVASLKGLAKGVYIVNGQKVIVK